MNEIGIINDNVNKKYLITSKAIFFISFIKCIFNLTSII